MDGLAGCVKRRTAARNREWNHALQTPMDGISHDIDPQGSPIFSVALVTDVPLIVVASVWSERGFSWRMR
jgi:hypothetical protein